MDLTTLTFMLTAAAAGGTLAAAIAAWFSAAQSKRAARGQILYSLYDIASSIEMKDAKIYLHDQLDNLKDKMVENFLEKRKQRDVLEWDIHRRILTSFIEKIRLQRGARNLSLWNIRQLISPDEIDSYLVFCWPLEYAIKCERWSKEGKRSIPEKDEPTFSILIVDFLFFWHENLSFHVCICS